MRVQKKNIDSDGSGTVVLFIEHEEDLWEIYNIVRAGDIVEGTAYRKVHDDRQQAVRGGR